MAQLINSRAGQIAVRAAAVGAVGALGYMLFAPGRGVELLGAVSVPRPIGVGVALAAGTVASSLIIPVLTQHLPLASMPEWQSFEKLLLIPITVGAAGLAAEAILTPSAVSGTGALISLAAGAGASIGASYLLAGLNIENVQSF